MNDINIIEAIVTWQAEGRDAGQRMLLLRFKRCNRSKENGGKGNCPFCDTLMKMNCEQEMKLPIKQIQKIIDKENCGLLITGGEPGFSTNLKQTVFVINEVNCHLVNVETNGHKLVQLISQVNPEKVVHYSLSPKIFNNEDLKEYITLIDNPIIRDNPNVYIKLVYERRDQMTKFLDYLCLIKFPNHRVYLMPEGSTKEVILEHAPMVFDAAEKYKFNFSSREHIIYGFV
jgi:organic radical activating enzyme